MKSTFAAIPLNAIRAAHYDRLNTALFDQGNTAWFDADDPTPGDGGDAVPVFDSVPDEDDPDELAQKLPYLILGQQRWNSDNTKTAASYEGGLRLHVWSLYRGGKEAAQVAERAIEAVQEGIQVQGWDLDVHRMEEVTEQPRIEAGLQVREAVVRPACRITNDS